MARVNASVSPRKAPVQERSKETVRRIFDAAARVLEDRGYDGLSTNRIAAAAGISPGSLYQYFPNKEAILKAMVSEYTDQLVNRVSIKLRQIIREDPANLVSRGVEAQVDAMLERPEILRVIAEQLPEHTRAEVLKPLERLMGEMVRGYAFALGDRLPGVDVDAASWILVQLLGTTMRYVVDDPPIPKDVFVKEMTRLVVGHPIVRVSSAIRSAS